MIFSGFILPDYTEVYTKSCSTLNGHIALVKRFLSNIEKQNLEEYEKLAIAMKKEKKFYALDDFAVTTLGWIKLIDRPYKFMFYPDLPYAYSYVLRYERLGYTTINLKCNLIHIDNVGKYIK